MLCSLCIPVIWARGERGNSVSLFSFTQASEHGSQLHAEGKIEHGYHKTKHYCWYMTFFFFPRKNRLTPWNLTMHSFLHGCLDFRDFFWIRRGRKGRDNNALQLGGLQEEQLTFRYRLFPPAFLSSLSPLLPPCVSVLTLPKVPPTWNPIGAFVEKRDLRVNVQSKCWAGNQGVELVSVFLWFPCLRQIPFYFFFFTASPWPSCL